MLFQPFKINSHDYTAHVRKDGISTNYVPISGLPEKYTMDGTLHDDVLINKAIYTIRFNPLIPAIAQEILNEYRAKHMYITVYDISTGTNRTIYVKPASILAAPSLVTQGAVVYWQIGDLTFREV